MGTSSYLDRDGFLAAQKAIQGVDQTLSHTYSRLSGGHFKRLREEHDIYGGLASATKHFNEVKRRIGELSNAMTDYLNLWDAAQTDAKNKFGQTEVENGGYTQSIFSDLYDAQLADGVDYTGSKAYWFYESGKSFREDYTDFSHFRYQSGYWPEFALWAKSIASWRKSTIQATSPELYYEPLLNASLEGMLKSLPGYIELDTTNTDLIDWDAMGEKLNCPGLKTLVKKLVSVGNKAGDVTDEDLQDLIAALRELERQFVEDPKLSDAVGMIASGLESINLEAVGNVSKGISTVMKVQEYAEFGLQMILHCLSDHSQQVEYLENTMEALLAAGYDEASVVENLAMLKTLYENKDLYVAQKTYDKLVELGVDTVDKAIGKLPVVKWVDTTYGTVGTAATIFANDQIKAANSMMGIMQYEGALTDTFERYTEMIREGIATEEDLLRADQIYDMLRVTKMKGYQDMMTIIGDKTAPGYISAQTKYNELKAMGEDYVKEVLLAGSNTAK